MRNNNSSNNGKNVVKNNIQERNNTTVLYKEEVHTPGGSNQMERWLNGVVKMRLPCNVDRKTQRRPSYDSTICANATDLYNPTTLSGAPL